MCTLCHTTPRCKFPHPTEEPGLPLRYVGEATASEVTFAMKKLLGLLLALVLVLCAASALGQEDVFVVSAADIAEDAWATGNAVTSDKSYLRVTCPAEGARVTLSIADAAGTLVYQRDYGECAGTFRSEDIYLKLQGSETTYHVSLWVGDCSYAFPIQRVMPRLVANAACAVGLPLQAMTGSSGWRSATLLDTAALEGRSLTVALHASNAYEIGTATFTISGGQLTISARLNDGVDGSIDKASIQVAVTALEAAQLARKSFLGQTAQLGQTIDLGGTPYAAVYLNLTVSFDPTGLPGSPETELDGQRDLWQLMQTETANEALG